MKTFLAGALLLFGLLLSARAQAQADDKYIAIYNLIQQADALNRAGQTGDALAVFTDAQEQLQHLQKQFPGWSPNVVSYRLADLAQKISALKGRGTAPKTIAPAAAPSEDSIKTPATVETLSAQLQAAQAENEILQAKLRESLAVHPALVDAGELARVREQIRWLMKENELLKVARPAPQKVAVTDTNAIAQARQELAVYIKKFSAQKTLAEKFAAENKILRASLSAAGKDAEKLAEINRQNAKLKDQITTLQTAQKNAPAQTKLSAELNDARSQLAQFQSAAAVSALEKRALEKKLRQQADEFESQRNELRRQLAAVAGKKSTQPATTAATQLAILNEEVKILRSRIGVAEAKPAPYTAAELALFKPAAPSSVNPEPIQRPLQQLPAGSAELVASAQRHFSKHEFEQAEADYLKILEHDQNNGLVLANLATIELQQGKLAAAEKHIQTAVAQNPDDAYNLSTLGYLKFRQEKYDDACSVLSRAAQLDPKNPEIQNYLGVALSHKGLRPQAEAALRCAVQLASDYAPAHNNLAVIYLSQENPVPALARWHYQKALDAGQPRNPDLEKMLADKGAPVAVP